MKILKMVFNSPTLLNYTSADLYSYERTKIQKYNEYLRYRPEIMSHLYIEIFYNTELNDNLDLPWDRKIRFIVRSRKKFCSQCTCQNAYPRGQTCKEEDAPRIFKSGDSEIEACHVSCFNLYEKQKFPNNIGEAATNTNDDDKNNKSTTDEIVRAPFLMYSYRQDICTIHNNSLFALGFDDYVRTDKHPLPRVDTIGTGFNFVDSGNQFDRKDFIPEDNIPYLDVEGNESFRFNMNRYYCDDFNLLFDGKKCYESLEEKIFGFLISSSLYKACQYGVRYAATGVTNTDIQKLNLPPIENKSKHTNLNSWKMDVDENAFFINPDVSLKDLGFTEDMKHCIFTTEYGYPGKIVEPLASGRPNITGNTIDYAARNKNKLPLFQYDIRTGRRLIDEYEFYGIYKYIRENPSKMEFNSNSINNANTHLVDFFKDLSGNLGQVGAMLVLGALIDQGTKYSKRLIQLSSEFLEKTFTPTLVHIVERRLMTEALNPILHLFSQSIIKLAKTSISLIKTADVITTVAGIVDLFDVALDFFNMQKVMDNGSVSQYSIMNLDDIRKAYGYGTVEYSAVTFMLTCDMLKVKNNWTSTPQSINKLKCITDYSKYKYMIPLKYVTNNDQDNENAYRWVSEYIFSLKVNSNGLKINWEEEGQLSPEIVDKYLKIDENVYLKGMDEYAKYTESFRKRVTFSKYAIIIIIILFLIVVYLTIQLSPLLTCISAIGAIYLVFMASLIL